METTTRTPNRKSSARKLAAKANKPVIDVPAVDEKKVEVFIKNHGKTITDYMTANFDEISEDDINGVIREAAECTLLKRSPKVGGAWGSDTSIIEDVLKAIGPVLPVIEAQDEEQELKPIESQDLEEKIDTTKPKMFKTKSKPAAKAKAEKKTAEKKQSKTTEKKVATKKEAKAKAEPKKADKKSIKAASVDSIKSLKGKDQWLAAARHLKGQKKIWIQTQDIPEVIGHVYDVSVGKAKLKEEGFDGKGEKVYRRNRILGFKTEIESFLKGLK